MKLSKLLKEVGISDKTPFDADLEITGITDDSRRVRRGFLFVAVKGLEHDGHAYIEQAIMAGAVAVVFDVNSKVKSQKSKYSGTTFVSVRDSRKTLGLLWAAWYGWPARSLKIIGVTGTDGKTTTANLIYHLLKSAGKEVGLISTINARIGNKSYDTGFHVTNPEPELLQKFLRKMADNGVQYAVIEVTSHGIDQERISGIDFAVAVITNVTHEHLDYHKTFKKYLAAKGRLFRRAKVSVLNRDDYSYGYLQKVPRGKIITYGLNGQADFRAANINLKGEGSNFVLHPYNLKINLSLPGRYNVANCLAAVAVASKLQITPAKIKAALATFKGLTGRFEEISEGQPFRVIVDFAHTPNALEQVLKLISKGQIPNSKSKVICVFGCAGERDKKKRPMMGKIAGKLADFSILTAEDPRREDVNGIIEQIAVGCLETGAKELSSHQAVRSGGHFSGELSRSSSTYFIKEPDRRKAIELAIKIARPGDLVLITGKGHEKSMCFGATEFPWSDQAVVRTLLKGSGAKN